MSDKLKTYIQQYKSRLDTESPNADLFDKIMKDYDYQKTKGKSSQNGSFSRFRWIGIAASLVILVCSALYYLIPLSDYKKSIQSDIIAKHLAHQNKLNMITKPTNTFTESLCNEVKSHNIHETSTIAQVALTKEQISRSRFKNSKRTPEIHISFIDQALKPVESQVQGNVLDDILELPSETASLAVSDPQIIADDVSSINGDLSSIADQSINESDVSSEPQVEESETNAGIIKDEDYSLKSVIKKGLFGLLSKKAREWSGNTLSLETKEIDSKQVLAVHFETDKLEFTKEIKLKNIRD